MSEDIEIDLTKMKIDQLGYVYKDIEKQAKIMEEALGMPKFTVLPPHPQIVKYRGKDSNIITKIAMTRMFDLQIELIELTEGECVFKEFLDKHPEGGLQHVSLFLKNAEELDRYITFFQKQGYEIVHQGNIGIRYFYYFDTTDILGFMFEVQASRSRRKKK
ncbi:MAG: VOC family protein [Promethearchaeota archaeon]